MKTLLVVMIILGMGFFALNAEAFCVYNRTDTKIWVEQTGGGKPFKLFSAKLDPGTHGCCHWENKDCNNEGKRDSIVEFGVTWSAGLFGNPSICHGFPIKAGGYVLVKGAKGVYNCEGHGY